MTTYDLYLESGPMRRKTMVHVPALLGCIAQGPTTDEAVAAAPDAIRTYLRFLAKHGERVRPEAPFTTHIAEHLIEGQIIGQGSPSLIFAPDLEPVTAREIGVFLRRFHAMQETLIAWAESRTTKQLEDTRSGGRPARRILLHILAPTGGYLSAALGGSKGFSAAAGQAERGEITIPEALRTVERLADARVRSTTPEERTAVRQRPNDVRTLRKALRRMLEHEWEHLLELSRRPGGPSL